MPRRALLLALWVLATVAATGISWRGVRLVTASVTDQQTAIPEQVVTSSLNSPPRTVVVKAAHSSVAAKASAQSPPATAGSPTTASTPGSTTPAITPPSNDSNSTNSGPTSAGGSRASSGNASPGAGGGTGYPTGRPFGGYPGGYPPGSPGSHQPPPAAGSPASGTPTPGTPFEPSTPAGPAGSGQTTDPTATYAAPGGVITVACHGPAIRLLSATPNDGYRLFVSDAGPNQVDVSFNEGNEGDEGNQASGPDSHAAAQSQSASGQNGQNRIIAFCVGGQPQQAQPGN